jgi:hypothetical protein
MFGLFGLFGSAFLWLLDFGLSPKQVFLDLAFGFGLDIVVVAKRQNKKAHIYVILWLISQNLNLSPTKQPVSLQSNLNSQVVVSCVNWDEWSQAGNPQLSREGSIRLSSRESRAIQHCPLIWFT